MRESWRARHRDAGAAGRARGERLARRLELGDDQRREIQRLIADFRGQHEGEIAALRAAIERLGDDWVAGNWHEGGLRQELRDALAAAGHDPEAFRRDLLELRAAILAVLTPEQAAKLPGHRLHLLRRLLEG